MGEAYADLTLSGALAAVIPCCLVDTDAIPLDCAQSPVLVTPTEGGGPPFIGMATLESLGFKVNPIAERLEPCAALEY